MGWAAKLADPAPDRRRPPGAGTTLPPTDLITRSGQDDSAAWLALAATIVLVSLLLIAFPRKRARR